MLEGKTFLVTGATGRLGCEAVNRLEQLGAEVIPLVLQGYPKEPKRVPWKAKTSPKVIDNYKDLKKIPAPDYIINFHWLVNRSLSCKNQLIYELNHILNTLGYFWDWCKDIEFKRFINISTIKVYSHLNEDPISSETIPKPVSPYGIAKYTAENFFEAYFSASNFKISHMRLCSVCSYGENPNHLLTRLYDSCFNDVHIKLNINKKVNIMHIDEVIDIIINTTIVEEFENIYLVTNNKSFSVKEIAKKFELLSNRKINGEYIYDQNDKNGLSFNNNINNLYHEWVRKYPSIDNILKEFIKKYKG